MAASDPATSIRVTPCTAEDAHALSAREPGGKDYARSAFAAQERGECLFLVAWLGDVPVGSGELTRRQVPELRNLHVDASFRRRGIGTALIAAAEDAARPHDRIGLGVGDDNPDALRLYERLGYRPTGHSETYTYEYVDDEGERGSATETALWCEKDLRPQE
jgi:ribosomal protein S18 acetylase RimI-like enzyme